MAIGVSHLDGGIGAHDTEIGTKFCWRTIPFDVSSYAVQFVFLRHEKFISQSEIDK